MVKKSLWVDSEAIRTNSYRFFLREDCGCSFDLCEYGEDIIEKSRTKYDAAFFYLYRIGFQTDELPEDFPFEAPEVYRNGIYVYNNFVKNIFHYDILRRLCFCCTCLDETVLLS